MKINYLVVILLSLGLIYLAKTNETCPNPNFKLKHWCQNCLNEEQALEFTIGGILLLRTQDFGHF